MDAENFKTCFVNEEILVLQMGGTIDKDYSKFPHNGNELEINEPACKRILSKIQPYRSVLVRIESIAKKSSSELTDDDRSALVETIINSSNRKFLVTHGRETIAKTAYQVAKSLKASGIEDKAVIFTGASTPERFRDSDADLNFGVALGFLQSRTTGIWITFGGLVLPFDRFCRLSDGHFVIKKKSLPVVV